MQLRFTRKPIKRLAVHVDTRSKATRLNAVTGAVTNSIRARYAVSAATNLGWSDRWLKVTPIRVAAS